MAGSSIGPGADRGSSSGAGPSRDELCAARLSDPNTDISLKLRSAQDLRDDVSRESYQSSVDYTRFIDVLLPVIIKVLSETPPSLWTCAPDARSRLLHEGPSRHPHGQEALQNAVRHLLLETLHRVPHHEPMRAQAMLVSSTLIKLMETDNEENAILALKIIMDLHKSYKDTIGGTASAPLDLVKRIYNNMSDVVRKLFGDENGQGIPGDEEDDAMPSAQTPQTTEAAAPASARSVTSALPTPGQPEQLIRKVPLGLKSTKVLAECPIVVVYLFQAYRELMPTELPILVPLVFKFLELQAVPQAKAHADAAAHGETFVGICPTLASRRALFTDLIIAQIKTLSFVAYFLRVSAQTIQTYRTVIPEVVVRMLKDCPPESASHRKELLIAARHILQTEFRQAFVPHVDTLVDDRVLIGMGVTCHEQLRPLAYSMIADLVHHVREELNLVTLAHVIHIYSCNLHDLTLAPSIQTMCSKLLLNLTENVVKQDTPDEAGRILSRSLEAFVSKLEAVASTKDRWELWTRPADAPRKEGEDDINEVEVERGKPIGQAAAMTDSGTDLFRDTRFLIRNLIFALKTTIQGLKHVRAPLPDAHTMGRLFRSVTVCMCIFDIRTDAGREHRETLETFVSILLSVEQLVFLEVIETNMAYFLDELLKNNELLAIPQSLLADQTVSQLFVGIAFRFLVSRLDTLGQGNEPYDSVLLRLFKMSFMAVTIFPELNEVVLQPHLAHIIMQSLKLAAKAPEPGCYYLLLRVLFRSIGGGRFELLYKEVIPLLEVLLTNLNHLLSVADRQKRDLFVELCLTVPVRLSVLLPYLSHLMNPLVLSLQAGADLVSQGLRTLELCVDNLTPEFLNPLMAPVQQDINDALWKLLRPVPFNHQHAHTTVRILGKIGGRNRKQLTPPLLKWTNPTDEATALLSFDGKPTDVPIAYLVDLALRMIRRGDLHYRRNAYGVLKHASVCFLKETLALGEQETTFVDVLRGLFEACRIEEFKEDATKYVREYSNYVFSAEIARQTPEEGVTKSTAPLSSALLDGIVENLASVPHLDVTRSTDQIVTILQDLMEHCKECKPPRDDLPATLFHQLALRLGSLCYDHAWSRKSGGHLGIDLLVRRIDVGHSWRVAHTAEFIRALTFMLKDMPSDPPGNVDQVVETMMYIIRSGIVGEAQDESRAEREKVQKYIVGFLTVELASQVETVRTTAQQSLALIAELNEVTLTELITPVKARLLKPIFTKPLRALAFPMQIGHMDAITFCMNLKPPLLQMEGDKEKQEGAPADDLEVSLSRLLTEALGIADADDVALTGGKPSHHSSTTQLIQLRVVCVRLLAAAMTSSEFLATKHTAMRNKILQVYFKLLYVKSPQVNNAAYESLKSPVQAGRLTQDLLKNGLRPVLVNLGDYKRLTVDSLHGLARLLELLPNYFKVEIGAKLLDHFRALGDPQTLPSAALSPQNENSEIKVMAAIINVFHLLPHPGSGTFLRDVCLLVVDTEKRLRKVSTSPFTEPLAKFVSRHVDEAATLFASQIRDEAWVTTFESLIAHPAADALREKVISNINPYFAQCFVEESFDSQAATHACRLVRKIIDIDPDFIKGNDDLVTMLATRWSSAFRRQRLMSEGEIHMAQVREDKAMLSVFYPYLQVADGNLAVDIYFRIMDKFAIRSPADPTLIARFAFEHIAKSTVVPWKQAVLRRFVFYLGTEGVVASHKAMVLRFVINPLLRVAFARPDTESTVCDAEYMNFFHQRVWQPWLNDDVAAGITDDAVRIEGLYMTTLIVRYRWQVMQDCRKDIIKLGWSYIKTSDPTSRAAAHCLIAQFLAVYESKPKILMPIYSTLLRTHQAESRTLTREALDVLTPALPSKCPQMEGGVHPWIRATRHILLDEGHSNMPQLLHIFYLLVRFPDVFYERRDLFVPHIVNALPRLCLIGSSATAETRVLGIDLILLCMNWDKKRLQIAKEEEATKMDVDGTEVAEPETSKVQQSPKRGRLASTAPSATSQSSSFQTYTIPSQSRDSIINGVLIRFIASNPELVSKGGLVKRSLDALKSLLDVWSDVNVKFPFLHRVLAETDIVDQHIPMLCNSVDILALVLTMKTDEWIKENIASLHKIVERGMSQQEHRLHTAYKYVRYAARIPETHALYRPVLERILSTVPTPSEREAPGQEAMKAFVDWITNVIADGIRQMTNLHSTIILLEAWASAKPDAVEPFMVPLVRVITMLAKEHINGATSSPNFDVHFRLLRSGLQLIRGRMACLGDNRRWILSALCTLVEKSSNSEIWHDILDIASQWVLQDHQEAFPTTREKSTLLGKLMVFENKDETLLKEFLQVILKIYSDPVLARSEYTVRLEQPFLLGCRNRDPALRCSFMEVFDKAITRHLHGRLNYMIGVQNWESLADTNWMHQAVDLLMGAVDREKPLLPDSLSPPETKRGTSFKDQLLSSTSGDLMNAARKLLYSDPEATHAAWIAFFKSAWATLSRRDQTDSARYLIGLLTKEYHLQNVDRRPNVIQTLLDGALACDPPINLPPHLVRYLGKTYNAWHTSLELIQHTAEDHRDEDTIRETCYDSLAETFADLSEDDYLYGLWRRRAFFTETNVSISFEQAGLWGQAQQMYEAAQLKARSGSLPFTESEYSLWEDHWILCTEKLQQWDILADLAKQESNNELLLECLWRQNDWATEKEAVSTAIQGLLPVSTPRRKVFEGLQLLIRSQLGEQVNSQEFQQTVDEGIQYSLRKWYHLPDIVSDSHIPLLHTFQLFVELQEAAKHIFSSLATTSAQNLDARSQELKTTLQIWRDRLPNLWDDVDIWSDIVAWRQQIFHAINRSYLPLLPANKDGQPATANSHAYRGYHETAWIINRFAHVARKHHLADVCINSLNRIYTLPNIEIQEAFLKLREQAKCHYQNPVEHTQGLEVINNTNLAYFNIMQKSEFYTLKGMFLARLGLNEEASQAFNQAVTMDMSFPKVWAEYGRYHDRLFKADPNDLNRATQAVSAYLQAAGLYKNAKSRKLLVRILWLLSLDDSTGTISKAFDHYTGELPIWYWITFVPQLISGLGRREARYSRIILVQIAKKFPQGLFFHLRTAKEDLTAQQKMQREQEQRLKVAQAKQNGQAQSNGTPATSAPTDAMDVDKPATEGAAQPSAEGAAVPHRTALEYVEEINSVLKTAFPLLALSLELVCDQIAQRFKAVPDEDVFRLISALLQDAMQQYINRTPNPDDDCSLSKSTIAHVGRFASNLATPQLRERFQKDFITSSPNLREYVQRLQEWRDRYERLLERRPKRHPLEALSHWLVEYKYQTFDEIEVPGQYLRDEDNNRSFVKISYFAPKVELGRLAGSFSRRLTMVGMDGSDHTFAVQTPINRTSRREEKIIQLFRLLNGTLRNRIEARKRGLQFHLPVVVSIGQICRLVESNSSVTTLQDVWEQHCHRAGIGKDDPILAYTEKLKELQKTAKQGPGHAAVSAKLEVYIEIAQKIFPDTILRDYFIRSTASATDLWHTRKQFTLHLAAVIFQTYLFSIGKRFPASFVLTRKGGQVHVTDLLPGHHPTKAEFAHADPVPFRLTPNMQQFITPIGIEGVLISSIQAIASCLTESEYNLEHRLSIFVAEEMQAWSSLRKMSTPKPTEVQMRDITIENVNSVLVRAKVMACNMEKEKVGMTLMKPIAADFVIKQPVGSMPVTQSVIELVSHATNPIRLSLADISTLPWL